MAKTTNKEKALSALLTTRSVAEASRIGGIPERTLHRYLNEDDAFRREYRKARSAIVENAISQMQQNMSAAVETLHQNLHCENPAVAARCAQIIYDSGIRGHEMTDIITRLEALENEHHQ